MSTPKMSFTIPSELQREILLRLPAEPLLRFRSACKPWLRTIDDPSFARSHFNNNLCSSPNLLIRTDVDTVYSFSLDSLTQINGEQTVDALRVKTLARQDVGQLPPSQVATCDGLLLISDHGYYEKIWVVWNPTTGDFHELPKPDPLGSIAGCGIGYDSASDDYKVVRIDSLTPPGVASVYRTLIYSLKLKSWKVILDCPDEFYHWGSEGVVLNNALHWRSRETIIVFDLATEKYRELPLPPDPSLPFDTHLDAFDGCLFLSEAHATKHVWVMKDFGVEPKWFDLFSVVERYAIGGSTTGWVWPVAYSKSQRHLILQHANEIIFWDIEKFSAKKVTIHGLTGSISSQICPVSLLRLDGGVGGNRLRGEASTRLKFSVTTTTEIPFLSDSEGSSSEAEEY